MANRRKGREAKRLCFSSWPTDLIGHWPTYTDTGCIRTAEAFSEAASLENRDPCTVAPPIGRSSKCLTAIVLKIWLLAIVPKDDAYDDPEI